jgi:hypothetical protein
MSGLSYAGHNQMRENSTIHWTLMPTEIPAVEFMIHPAAAKYAQELTMRAMDGLSSGPTKRAVPPSTYSPQLPIVASLGPEDLRGPILGRRVDRFGRESERHYADSEHVFVLTGPAFDDFTKAVSAIHQQRTVREVASERTIGNLTFEWMCKTRIAGPTASLIDYLLVELKSMVRAIEIVIPVFGLHVETRTTIGHVTLVDITQEELQGWREMSCRNNPTDVVQANLKHDELRKRLQGRASARFKTIAVPEYAAHRATEQAELSLAILRLASIGAFAPEIPTTIALAGRESIPRGEHIMLGTVDAFASSEYIVNADDLRPWVIDDTELRERLLPVIAHWSALLVKTELTKLEDRALTSALVYSRATQYRNTNEKLIHMFAAVESLLLRTESEPISAAVADRLAFAVGRTADERMRIVRNVRDVYAMRSRFVHHAIETAPDGKVLAQLEEFFVTISQFFVNMKDFLFTFEQKDPFLDALDRQKYS